MENSVEKRIELQAPGVLRPGASDSRLSILLEPEPYGICSSRFPVVGIETFWLASVRVITASHVLRANGCRELGLGARASLWRSTDRPT
jgi:hypothetical protein